MKVEISKLVLQVKLALAASDTSEEVLDELSREHEDNIRIAVGENVRTAQRTLGNLARDPSLAVQIAVAKNPKTSKIDAEWLGHNASIKVILLVLDRDDLSKELLDDLSRSPIVEIRRKVAQKVITPKRILGRMIYDSDIKVLINLSGNPNIPGDKLDYLVRNVFDYFVMLKASKNPAILSRTVVFLSKQNFWEIRAGAGSSKSANKETLIFLGKDPVYSSCPQKYRVFQNKNTPENVRNMIKVLDPDSSWVKDQYEFLLFTKENKILEDFDFMRSEQYLENLPVYRLKMIVEQSRSMQVLAAVYHCSTSSIVQRAIARNKYMIDETILDNLAQSPNMKVKIAVAYNKGTALKTFKKMFKINCEALQVACAKSEKIDSEIFYFLSHSPYRSVKYCLLNNRRTPNRIQARLRNELELDKN